MLGGWSGSLVRGSMRASCCDYPMSSQGKPDWLPAPRVHSRLAAGRRRLSLIERERNGGIEMAVFHAHAAYRTHLAHADGGTRLDDAVARVVETLRTWYCRASTRRELRALDDRLLADIGMSRAETTKPFWQA